MRALDPEVVDAAWEAFEPLLPERPADEHPLGCHRGRIPDRVCFEGIVIRLVTGCSWVDVETLLGNQVSDTTLRARRDEWVQGGVFDALVEEAVAAYDRIVGLDLEDVAIDASAHKAPTGGEGTGRNGADRGKIGWKWTLAADGDGIPIGWVAGPANRHDIMFLEPALGAVIERGLLHDIGVLHLDRGYDAAWVDQLFNTLGIDTHVARRRKSTKGIRRPKRRVPLGQRWPVERTNSWLSNFGQLRRNTDRRITHRLAQLALAIVLLITGKLIDWRDRWSLT